MINAENANSAITMNPNLKKVYSGKKSLKPTHKKRRHFSKIRKVLKKQQKS